MLRTCGIAACLLSSVLFLGCGKTDEHTPFMNETLGAQGLAPSSVTVDTSILNDQTSYKPANPPAGVAVNADSAGAKGSSGPEVDAVRKTIHDAANSLFQLDFASAFDFFDPDQVQTLIKDKSAFIELGDKIGNFARVVRDKSGEKVDEAKDATERKKATDSLVNACKIETVDAENAAITFDLSKAVDSLSGATSVGKTALEQAKALATGKTLQFRAHKVSNGWKIHLPISTSPEMVEAVQETIPVGRDLFDKLSTRVDQMQAFSEASLQQVLQEVLVELAPEVNNLTQKWQKAVAAPSASAPAQPESKPPAPQQPEPPQAGGSRSPRSPRSP